MNFIYLLIEKETNAPLYIGKTVNLARRLGSHSKYWASRYGLEIEMIVLEECERSWQEAEIEWIAFFRSFCKIENKLDGGNGFSEDIVKIAVINSHTKESRQKAELTKRRNGTVGSFSRSAIQNAQLKEVKIKRIETARRNGGMKKSVESMFTDEAKSKRVKSMRKNKSFGRHGQSLTLTNEEKRFIANTLGISFEEAGKVRKMRKSVNNDQ